MLRCLFFFILVLLSNVPSVCFAGLSDHPRIVVLQFVNKSHVNHPVLDDKTVAKSLLIEELVKSDCFDVVDSALLDLYAKQKNLKPDNLADTAKIAKALGISYLFTGYIDEFKINDIANRHQTSASPDFTSDSELRVALATRIIDAETEKPVLVVYGTGRSHGRLVNGQWSRTGVRDALAEAVTNAVHGENGLIDKIKNYNLSLRL